MRKLINQIIDKITGFELSERLEQILQMDSWERNEIEEYQQKQFNVLKQYAQKSSVYKGCPDWSLYDFPVYSKTFYIRNYEKFLTGFRKPFQTIYTSGTTGIPMKIPVSIEMLLHKRVSHLKMLHWFGMNREDFELAIGGNKIGFGKSIYYFFKNKKFLSSKNLSERKALRYIRIINRTKPIILFSYPFALDIILSYAGKKNRSLFQPQIVYTGAENLNDATSKKIQKFFPESSLVNEYWSTEANIAVSCPYGKMHIDEDTIIAECVNKDKNGVGDLLITNLYSYDFPLIRYPLGDRVKLGTEKCPCGRNTRIIEFIEGRNSEYFELGNGKKIYFTGHGMLLAELCNNIVAYQIEFYQQSNKTIFNYVVIDDTLPVNEKLITNYFQDNFELEITLKRVRKIEADKSGKYSIIKTIK